MREKDVVIGGLYLKRVTTKLRKVTVVGRITVYGNKVRFVATWETGGRHYRRNVSARELRPYNPRDEGKESNEPEETDE